jgi:hypothetical protein
MYVRGNVIAPYICRPEGDVSWTPIDYARAETLEARYASLNISEAERKKYIQCAIMIRKFPGIVYPEEIMTWLSARGIHL